MHAFLRNVNFSEHKSILIFQQKANWLKMNLYLALGVPVVIFQQNIKWPTEYKRTTLNKGADWSLTENGLKKKTSL